MQVATGWEDRLDEHTVRVSRISCFSGKMNFMVMKFTQDQWNSWKSGQLIQDAFPNLSLTEREFILTGATQEEWDSLFGNEEDEEADLDSLFGKEDADSEELKKS